MTPIAKRNPDFSHSYHLNERDTDAISDTDGSTISLGQNCSDETICPKIDKCLTVSDDHVRAHQLQQLSHQDQMLEENTNKTILQKIADNSRDPILL
ncbi:hypothetical protein SNEBB_003919 [Seison nebaliae]|nr:hypothetical protein SNEBB_003919 [Seison nebaliae]